MRTGTGHAARTGADQVLVDRPSRDLTVEQALALARALLAVAQPAAAPDAHDHPHR
ncbi:hypothetical protein [Actinomadura oligospora]|uniref:hypothetical protein n=1 Tax=Actinomadura oligospora TaxID=111804 RepID=UPI0012FB9471|nr:hypothetical protein [Actinomadura oligospora]